MLILMLLLAFQEHESGDLESINARLFLDREQIDLTDVRIKGIEPYTFEFHSGRSSTLTSLMRVSKISRNADGRNFDILFTNGEKKTGRIKSIAFTGNADNKTGKRQVFYLLNIERIHFIHGDQLRSCATGHYEHFTPYPFCPVCGNELQIGAYEEPPPQEASQPPLNRLRQDGRDPSSTSIRGSRRGPS